MGKRDMKRPKNEKCESRAALHFSEKN
jgi:hypothetical protein